MFDDPTLDGRGVDEALARAGRRAIRAWPPHIRTKPAEIAVLRSHDLRVFWLAGKRDLTTWGYLDRIVRRWDDIEEALDARGPGPWFSAINANGLREINI